MSAATRAARTSDPGETLQKGAPSKDPLAAVNWNAPGQQAALLASDQKISKDTGVPVNQLSPALIQAYQQEVAQRADTGNLLAKYTPALALAVGTMGVGSAAGAALGGAAASGGAAATAGIGGAALGSGGALTTLGSTLLGTGVGALSGGANAIFSGGNIGKGILTGGLEGGVGGFLGGVAKPATSALSTSTGLSPGMAGALVKGGIGAGTSALGAGLTGGNVGSAALMGGARGAVTPVAGNLINNSTGLSPTVSNAIAGVGTGALLGAALGSSGSQPSQSQGNNVANPMMNTQPVANPYGTGAGANTPYDFSSTGSTLGSLLGPVATTAAGVYGAQNSAEAQVHGINNAENTQVGAMQNISNLYTPQQTLGNESFNALGSTLGVNGQPANYSNFYNMPGYQFAVQQGTQAINRQASASGNAYQPSTDINIGKYVTGTAAQDYNTYVGQLMQTAGFGNQANQGLTGANLTTSGNISQLQQNSGNAQASGVAGSAGAISSLLGKLPWGSMTSGGSPGSTNPGSSSAISPLTSGSTNASGYDLANQGGTLSDMTQPTSGYLSDAQLGGGNPIPTDASGNLDWLNLGGSY